MTRAKAPLVNEAFEVDHVDFGVRRMVVERIDATHVHLSDRRFRLSLPRADFAAKTKRLHTWSDNHASAESMRCSDCGLVVKFPACEGGK